AAMDASWRDPLEAVVLARADRPALARLEPPQRGTGPVQALELPVVEHRLVAVDRDRVVAGSAHEVAVPLGRAVVAVAPRVDEHVVPLPPHVELQHVDLAESVAHAAAAERAEAPRV